MKNILLIEPYNKPYGYAALDKSLGGSETIFLFIRKYLDSTDHNVVVCFKGDKIPEEKYDLALSWRDPMPLMGTNATKRACYFQDLPSPQVIQQLQMLGMSGKLNTLIFLSHFQKEAFLSQLPPDMFIEGRHVLMTENGIDTDLFSYKCDKENYFLYASAPNRGLDILLEMWPKIHEQLPDHTLRIAGGVDLYNVKGADPEDIKFREEFLSEGVELFKRAEEMEGVEVIGGLSQADLIKVMLEAKALLYPNTFTETSCHVVNMALHAGCNPVTTPLGALSEKIVHTENGFLISADPQSNEYKEGFIHTVVSATQSGTFERMTRTNLMSYSAWDYRRVYERMFNRLLDDHEREELEGHNIKIMGVCCSLKGNNKRNFSNMQWYAPIDMQTDEVIGMPVDQARCVAASLAVHKGADCLLLVDDDIYADRTFVTKMLQEMIEHKADVVCADYWYKEDDQDVGVTRVIEISSNRAVNTAEMSDGELNSVGMKFITSGLGACLITTDLLKKIGRPQFRTQQTMQGKHTGEDSYFFEQCRMLGAKIRVVSSIPIVHMGNGKAYGKKEYIQKVVPQLL